MDVTVVGVIGFLGFLLAVPSGPTHTQRCTPLISLWIVAEPTQPSHVVVLTGLRS